MSWSLGKIPWIKLRNLRRNWATSFKEFLIFLIMLMATVFIPFKLITCIIKNKSSLETSPFSLLFNTFTNAVRTIKVFVFPKTIRLPMVQGIKRNFCQVRTTEVSKSFKRSNIFRMKMKKKVMKLVLRSLILHHPLLKKLNFRKSFCFNLKKNQQKRSPKVLLKFLTFSI